jgi:hypothetical protein
MSADIPDTGFPSEATIAAIGRMTDAVQRNTWITWSYHRLDRAMEEVTGTADLSWRGFAVWASQTAGTFISESAFPKILTDWVNGIHGNVGVLERIALLFLDVVGAPLRWLAQEILGDVVKAIGDGNQAVFIDIAPPFSRLLARLDGRPRLPPEERAAFLASIHAAAGGDSTKALRWAFAALLDGMDQTAPGPRAERVCVANCWTGWVEQTHMQPYIVKSMNAPIADLFFEHLEEHIQRLGLHGVRFLTRDLRRTLLAPLAALFEVASRDIETKIMMTLQLPHEDLRLGNDVSPLPSGNPFPEALTRIESPDLDEVLTLLHAQELLGSGASDWSSFDQRMRYIGVLFRSRQQEASLRNKPARPKPPAPRRGSCWRRSSGRRPSSLRGESPSLAWRQRARTRGPSAPTTEAAPTNRSIDECSGAWER